jgi:hypothetical protein
MTMTIDAKVLLNRGKAWEIKLTFLKSEEVQRSLRCIITKVKVSKFKVEVL